MRPGTLVSVRDNVPPRSAPTDVDVWFVVGLTEKGSTAVPKLIRSMTDYETEYGERDGYTTMYDSLEVAFREGLARAYIQRVVGAVPVAASVVLDEGGVDSVRLTANSPGDWGEGLQAAVIAGVAEDSIKFQILDADDVVLETSPEFTDKATAITWTSNYVTPSSAGAGGLPDVAAAAALTGGDDDLDTVNDASYVAGLEKFNVGLGPGQVSVPGNVASAVQLGLLAHAYNYNRVALLDAPDSGTVGTLTAAALALRTSPYARYGAMFGPRATAPGLVSLTTRSVPYVAVQAGLMARHPNPNLAAAGLNGVAQYVQSVKYDFTDPERETLNSAGVDIARNMLGGVRTYGYRTLVDPDALPNWRELSALRTIMAIKAKAGVITENHLFDQIDGRGITIAGFGGELSGMLIPYFEQGALYGETADEAFFVDVGTAVNTPATIADGRLRAVIALKTSPFAELVEVEIVKQAITA